MKRLMNTLYVINEDRYLSLDGENVAILSGGKLIGRMSLHNLDAIVTFGYQGASPALMGACAKRNIDLCFMSRSGKFLARVIGAQKGNVLLRKEQYRVSAEAGERVLIARNFITAKVFNSRWILERATRDYPMRLDVGALKTKSAYLARAIAAIRDCVEEEKLRGLEGEAATTYFSAFDDLILQQKEDFAFSGRNRRPPLDEVNCMMSFAYALLCGMCVSALESVGLDPYVGFLHTDRAGRASLALDLMEEFRSVYADRFVLNLINKRLVSKKGFLKKESGAVIMTDDAKKVFLEQWQTKKFEIITHPYLKEKIEWGLAPFAQALLLARFLRGDLDEYPPFLWK